jgi:predicted acyltransferase
LLNEILPFPFGERRWTNGAFGHVTLPTSTAAPAETTAPSNRAASPIAGPKRFVSVDALRGFDMFWIIGADMVIGTVNKVFHNKVTGFLQSQFAHHKKWEGVGFYDLIFPLFIFLAGVSLVFSLSRTIQQHGRARAASRILRRGLLLVALGIFYYGGFSNSWPEIRLVGVLQLIGWSCLFAGLVFTFCRPRLAAVVCALLLGGYWAALNFIPIRDIALDKTRMPELQKRFGTRDVALMYDGTTNFVSGKFQWGLNVANHADFLYLPGKKHYVYWDPEGLLSVVPGTALCLLGTFAGLLLQRKGCDERRKVGYLLAAGIAGVVLGWLWNLQTPVIKQIWTPSYILVAAGYAALLLAAFHQIIEVWGFQRWAQPFVWIGMNPLTVYLLDEILDFRKVAERLVGGDVRTFLDQHLAKGMGDVAIAVLGLGLAITLCWYLHRKRVFVRL